jgi:periplasmic copper chaperone A
MTRPLHRLVVLLFAVVLLGAACGDDDTPDATDPGDDADTATVTVDGAWARTSPMMATNGAVYMELTASVDDQLVAAQVDATVAAAAEVHETTMDPDSGQMGMGEVDAIELPAGEAVALEPGGFHVMLLDLAEPLEVGTTIEVTLTFAEAGELVVAAEVRDTGMHGG